ETLRFSGVKPGDVVADYVSGSGYFTRLLLSVVGPQGHVYSVEPSTVLKYVAKELPEIEALTATHPNLTVSVASPMEGTRFPQKLDLFFIAQNYHDMHDKFMGPVDIGAFNAAVYKALKPGGIYLVLDHVAASGAPADVTETLHRIDPAVVRREVEAAGFKFDGESRVLANPDDPHSLGVFDKSIRGHTDQFIYRFRKPR
ncbi:MAG: class I SAM-dependent methyltransferase, partial [Gammaproteobacteria bacterium]|nr:class I SAM-dependent methyltransferase [Gammaproteobacteria bacterium]